MIWELACTVFAESALGKPNLSSSLRVVHDNEPLRQPLTRLISAWRKGSLRDGRRHRYCTGSQYLVRFPLRLLRCPESLERCEFWTLICTNGRGGRAFREREEPNAMAPTIRKEIGFEMSPQNGKRTPALKFWDDCADPMDIQALWAHPAVKNEWITAGEKPGQKVHLSRAFEGQPYITEVEMRAIAEIIIRRYFTKLDPTMICAIAEIESSRNPLAYRWEESVQTASTGLMQVLQSTADWLAIDMGYKAYTVDWTSSMLYRPFVSVYFGAAYLKWLSTYEGKRRSEEFMVRGYNGGPKGAASKSTLEYWTKYLIAKQNIQMKSSDDWVGHYLTFWAQSLSPESQLQALQLLNTHSVSLNNVVAPPEGTLKPNPWPRVKPTVPPSSDVAAKPEKGRKGSSKQKEWTYWEEKCSAEDLETMWSYPDVKKEWVKAGEQKGKVRFSRDTRLRPFLTVTELKAIAEIITARFFTHKGMSAVMLCSIAEISSNRLLHGLDGQSGIMGLPFATALWLYQEMGYKSYKLKVNEDLSKPFVGMYFGAAYVCWLSNHNNRPRSDEFVVRSYKGGVEGVDHPASRAFWIHFLEAKSHYRFNPTYDRIYDLEVDRTGTGREVAVYNKSQKKIFFRRPAGARSHYSGQYEDGIPAQVPRVGSIGNPTLMSS